MNRKNLLAVSILLFLTVSGFAQDESYTISGTVYESGSQETLPGAVIVCTNLNVGASSNAFGFYSLTLPKGTFHVICSFVGYGEQSFDITLDKSITKNFFVARSTELETVVISAEKKEKISEDSRMSTIDIPIDQIKNIPALLGEKEFWARFDRRHDGSLVLIYKLNDNVTLSGSGVYGTGQAISLPLATFPAETHWSNFGGGSIGQDYGNNAAEDYGDRNSFRMKPYHLLDEGIQWHKQKETCERTFELGLYNAYSRRNPYYYYLDTYYDGTTGSTRTDLKQISLFPILPSVSWTWKC
jgi:hypothetical protein